MQDGPGSKGLPVPAEVVAGRRTTFDELSCHDSALYGVESAPWTGDGWKLSSSLSHHAVSVLRFSSVS